MAEESANRAEAYEFVLQHVDSVPQLEALLLLWNSRPRVWTVREVADRLYVTADAARAMLNELGLRGLIACVDDQNYGYLSDSPDKANILQAVDETYRREMVPLSSMIHSKASRAVLDFARAFRFKKERE